MNYEAQAQPEEEDDVNTVLWVGNLDSKVTEGMIYELFISAGPVKNIHFPKGTEGQSHKGYCFVQFYHEASVPYTIELMEGTTMYGRKLKLQPRPGSVHRKIMDQKIAEKRQELLFQQQHQTHLLPQPQQQWFGLGPPPDYLLGRQANCPTAPQLAQIQNMVIYQNQMFQPYPAAQNANHYPVAFQSPVGPQIMQIQIQQQQQAAAAAAQQQHHPQSPPQQSPSRHFQQQQLGYSFISSPTQRIPNAIHSSVASSQVTPLNGSPNFPRQHQPRGVTPRPRHAPSGQMAIANGHIANGNRISFQQQLGRHPAAAAAAAVGAHHQYLTQAQTATAQLHQQQQLQLVSPIYPHQPLLTAEQTFVAAAPVNPTQPSPHDMQFFRRPATLPQQQPIVAASPSAAAAAAALGLGNGYQNIHIYHY